MQIKKPLVYAKHHEEEVLKTVIKRFKISF